MARPEIALLDAAAQVSQQAEPNDHVNRFMRLALWIAGRNRNEAERAGIEWQDLQGTALLALVKASKTYSKSKAAAKGIPFKAYMSTAIKYEISDLLQKASLAHMPSRSVYNDVRSLTIAAAALQSRTESEHVTDKQLAEELGWTVEKVQKYQLYSRALLNYKELQQPLPGLEKDETLGDSLSDDTVDVEGEAIANVTIEAEGRWLAQATAELPPLARTAIILTFGLPVPSGVPSPTIGDVIRVALNQSASASRGLRQLREVRKNDRGDMPELGKQDTAVRFGGRKSPQAVGDEAAQRVAIEIFERYSSEPGAIPALQR